MYPNAESKELQINSETVQTLAGEYGRREYLYGTQPPFTFSADNRFDWGSIDIKIYVEKGIIKSAKVYTDSMDWELAPLVEKSLTNCFFDRTQMQEAIKKHLVQNIAEDVCSIFEENI